MDCACRLGHLGLPHPCQRATIKAPANPRVNPNKRTLAGATVLPPGTQSEVQVVTCSTESCLLQGRAEFLENNRLHLAYGHQKKVRRHEPFSVLLVILGLTNKSFANGTLVGVAQSDTGKARRFSQGTLLEVQKELADRRALDKDARIAGAEEPLEAQLDTPEKEPETSEMSRAGVSKDLHGKVLGLLDQFKGT